MRLVLALLLGSACVPCAVYAQAEPRVAGAAVGTRPHIVMVMGDDIGWANVGWNRHPPTKEVQTPVLDSLVAEGIELTNFYAFKYCSPSRSAFLSGRNPIHVNVVNGQTTLHNPDDPVSGYSGIPVNMTTVAHKLRGAGYATHAVGKWDAGMATFTHTPAGRGFNSWLGYFGHCNDYWTEIDKCGMSTCPSEDPETSVNMVDMWEQEAGVSRPASSHNNSQQCSQSNQMAKCAFEDDVFLDRVVDVVTAHSASQPIFLYWAAHACHGPREVPMATYNKFNFIDDKRRQMYNALMNYLDTMVGTLHELLVKKKMWSNTLFVFSSDNGGDGSANNFPHRGEKFSNWQGGIHVPAFVSGGALPPARRGIKLGATGALWDLYATFGQAAGLSPTDAMSDSQAAHFSLPAVDSLSQWDLWVGSNMTAPRTELAIGTAIGDSHGGGDAFFTTGVEALILGDMKLILTPPDAPIDEAVWTGPQYPNKTSNMSAWLDTLDCSMGCLYNITADQGEHFDLAASRPDVVAAMQRRIVEINQTAFSPQRGANSPNGCKVALGKYGGFWGPFVGVEAPADACGVAMTAACPLGNFSSYEPCRACLKTHMGMDNPHGDVCRPAAPTKFQVYCCSRFRTALCN